VYVCESENAKSQSFSFVATSDDCAPFLLLALSLSLSLSLSLCQTLTVIGALFAALPSSTALVALRPTFGLPSL
jgi:hypothetical protein